MIEFLGSFPRGGIVRLALNFSATAGERPSDIELVEADARFSGEKPTAIMEDMPKVAPFVVEPRGADEGWFLTLPDTAALDLGFYVADLRITVAGEVSIGPPATFQITESVTRRPE